MILVFNMPPDYVGSDFVNNTSDKVPIVPKLLSPKLFPNLGKLFKYLSGRYTLHYLPDFRRRIFWGCLRKYVHMVFHYFHRIYIEPIFLSYFSKYLFKIARYFFTQDMLPVLRYPHKVILQVIYSMFGPSYAHANFIAGLSNFRNLYLFTNRVYAAEYPPASWRVFSRRILIKKRMSDDRKTTGILC